MKVTVKRSFRLHHVLYGYFHFKVIKEVEVPFAPFIGMGIHVQPYACPQRIENVIVDTKDGSVTIGLSDIKYGQNGKKRAQLDTLKEFAKQIDIMINNGWGHPDNKITVIAKPESELGIADFKTMFNMTEMKT